MTKGKYIRTESIRRKLSETRIKKGLAKGNKNPMFGKKRPELSEFNKRTKSKLLRDLWADPKYRKIFIEKLSGKNNPAWIDGRTKLSRRIRHLFEYRLWVQCCMKRDNYTCQSCKIIGGDLEVHHIKSFVKILRENNINNIKDARRCNELWAISNGITYCYECHHKKDKFRRLK